jgi:hypothetical protein
MAFCKACRMKHPIALDIAHRLDDQELHASILFV